MYVGETARGYGIRVMEEMKHIAMHQQKMVCTEKKAKGRCDVQMAIRIAAYGVQRMLIIPYALTTEAETKLIESDVIRRFKPQLNRQYYYLQYAKQPTAGRTTQAIYGMTRKRRKGPGKKERAKQKRRREGQQSSTDIIDLRHLPYFSNYTAADYLALAPSRDIFHLLQSCLESGITSLIRIHRSPGRIDASGPGRRLTIGKSLCKVYGLSGLLTLKRTLAIYRISDRHPATDFAETDSIAMEKYEFTATGTANTDVAKQCIEIQDIQKKQQMFVVLKACTPKKRSDHPIYKKALSLATGNLTAASWGKLYQLTKTDILQLWSMSFYLPTQTLINIAVPKVAAICVKKFGFVPPTEVKGLMPFSHSVRIKPILYEVQRLLRHYMTIPRELAINITSIVSAAFKGRQQLQWTLESARNMCRKRKRGDKGVCGCRDVANRLMALGCKPHMIDGHIFMTFKMLTGYLRCFANVSVKTVPIPTKSDDLKNTILMLNRLVMSFAPLLSDVKKVKKLALGIAYQQSRVWKPIKVNTALDPITTEKVESLIWAIQGCVCATVDKDGGEMLFECQVPYFDHYDKMFPVGDGSHIVELKVKKFSRKVAAMEWSKANRSVENLRYWCEKGEVAASKEEQISHLQRWQYFMGCKLGWDKQSRWSPPKGLGCAFCLRKHKYVDGEDGIVEASIHKMRPVENIGVSGWKGIQRAAAKAWGFMITKHKGAHFALTNISKFTNIVMEKQKHLRTQFGIKLGLFEVTSDISDYFTRMLWDLSKRGGARVLDAAAKDRRRYISVQKTRGKVRPHIYFGRSNSDAYYTFSLEDLKHHQLYWIHNSCVQLYSDLIVRHANGVSLAMGGFGASADAILGGIEMEEVFNASPKRHELILKGHIQIQGIRVQDDTKLLIGFDCTVTNIEEVTAIFHHNIAPLLYPPPFIITYDTRNRYLECHSMQVDSFIWYKHYHKNGPTLMHKHLAYKSNTSTLSYGKASHKRVTIIGHLERVRRNSVFEEEAMWLCICKLLEVQTEGVDFKPQKLRAYLCQKMMVAGEDYFWGSLLEAFNRVMKLVGDQA
jgi:hypothetical protein